MFLTLRKFELFSCVVCCLNWLCGRHEWPQNLDGIVSLLSCCNVSEPLSMYPWERNSVVLSLLSCLIHSAVDHASVGYDLFLWITTKDSWWFSTFSYSFLLETSSRLHSFSSVACVIWIEKLFSSGDFFLMVASLGDLYGSSFPGHIVIQTLFSYINTTSHRKQAWANSYQTYYD